MAKQRSKRASSTGSDEFEVAPFSFDAGQAESSARSPMNSGKLPDMPLGQFSDAEMEFEPFMFDSGEKGQAASQGLNVDAAPSGFSFEPFNSGKLSTATVDTQNDTAAQGSPIVGGDLPLPSYFTPSQYESVAQEASTQNTWEPEHPTTPVGSDNTTSGLKLPTGPISSLAATETGGLSAGRGDQMTGRTPSGPMPTGPMPTGPMSVSPTPSTPLTQPPASAVTGLGRTTRGNTGPLGPLPPDRLSTPNASWSDSSLASIEDFSSILIAMQAGKKLRQSGPLNESMLPPAVAQVMEESKKTAQETATTVEQRAATATPTVAPMATPSKPLAPSMVDAFEHQTDSSDMPDWARQATQEQPAVHVEEHAPGMDTGAEQAMESATPSGELSPEHSWVTGHMEPTAANVDSIMAADQQVVEAPVVPAQPEPPATPQSTTAAAAQAELEKRKSKTPSNLDPEVAEALSKVEPVLASGTLTGDELEFEGFMFNKGASAPLAALNTPSTEEMDDLHADMGPVFDPTPWAMAVEAEEESDNDDDYGDMDFLREEYQNPGGTPTVASAPDTSSHTGGLPFWLQGDANEAPTGMLLQDIARRPWGTKEFLMEQPSSGPSIPSEWVGSVVEPAPAPKVEAESGPSAADFFGSAAPEDDYGQLPPFEPFDFGTLPVNDKVESLGFNTEELSGLAMNEHDPMTATVNLAAVADLLGAPEDTYEDRPSEPVSSWQAEDMAPASTVTEEAPRQEWSQDEVEMPTVAGLDMYETEPAVEAAAEPTMEMEPAVEMRSDMPTMEVMDASDMADSGYAEDGEAEMPTLSLDAASMDYGQESEPSMASGMPAYPEYAEASEESPEESYVEEVAAPVMETKPEEPVYTYEAQSEPVYEAPAPTPAPEPVHSAPATPSLPTTPIGESSHNTKSWMSNPTTDLSESALADMAGEHTNLVGPATEMDLAMDGEEISPFNYDQLDLEADDEQHTGHLESDQISRTYGTGKLAMPDEEDMLLRSRPLTDMWSEADGDASLFVTEAQSEQELPGEAIPTLPTGALAAQPEYESEPAGSSEYTDYAREQSHAYEDVTADESYQEPVAVVIVEPVVEYRAVAEAEPEQPAEEFKVRVASQRPWMAYTESQNRVEAPAPQFTQSSPRVSEAETTGPLHDDQVDDYQPAPMAAAPEQTSRRAPDFDRPVKLPSHIDILVTGPLPALEGFEDVNEWAGVNTQDMGAQLAIASAYAQSEDFDAALRVYRKIIRKPGTSDTMLRMIGDDLTDIEDVASHLPRYWQVMGDLLLRLGRHREAVEAYNKLK